MQLTTLDYIVFVTYALVIITIGLWVAAREQKTSSGYFLAGRSLPWYVIGFSLIASSVSTEQFIGEVGYAYRYGMAVANWEWGVLPAFTIMLCFFVPFYLRHKISTMPEYLELRFGTSSRVVFAVITVLIYVFVNLAAVLYSCGMALSAIFDVDIFSAVVVIAIIAGVYTIAGGLASVVWTDLVQAILLLGGGLLVFALGLQEVGWESLRGTGDRGHLILPADHEALPWTGMVVLFLSTNTWYYATNQYINQRVLGAKDEWHARAGLLFAALLGIPLTLAVCLPGLVAYEMFPGLENPDEAYPRVIDALIGPLGWGIRGLIFAGLTGAIMSTIDSLTNSLSTILTVDFYQRFWNRTATERQMIRFGRFSAATVLTIGVLWSPLVGTWESIFTYFQDCYALIAVPIVVVFLAGFFWRRTNNLAATATLLLCLPLMVLPLTLRKLGFTINVFNVAGLLILPVIVFHVAAAYLGPAPDRDAAERWIWKPSMLKLPRTDEQSPRVWYKSLLLWWLIILLLYVMIYAWLW